MTVIISGSSGVGASASSAIPAFNATLSGSQSVSTGVWTKAQCNVEDFDTGSLYDNVTNFRFQPTVAGYYQINGSLYGVAATTLTGLNAAIYKNGAVKLQGAAINNTSGVSALASVCGIVFLNGSTDYVELWGNISGTGALTFGGAAYNLTGFNGCLMRIP